jgi:hypothetical protein
MNRRSYNHLYQIGRFCVQVLLTHQKGLVVALVPAVDLVINGDKLLVGFGLQWMFGQVNFGIMRKSFVESENHRLGVVHKEAERVGISDRQQALRWGW